MNISLTKRNDGDVILRCTRVDGSTVWQHQRARHAGFFPLHDLTHYAIETTLVMRSGFYGLIEQGWTFADFDKPWPKGPLPLEAAVAEFLTGCFDQERATGALWTTQQLNDSLATYLSQSGRNEVWPTLTDAQLDRIRKTFNRVFERWRATSPDQSLELTFEITGPRRAAAGQR